MKYKQIVVLVFIFSMFLCKQCFGQDTLHYCLTNSPWVSSCYSFYKVDRQSIRGTFEKSMYSDDGQRWYGSGTFTEYQNKIILDSFKIVRTIYHISGDSLLKDPLISDTTNVPIQSLYKKGYNLYQKGMKKKRKIICKKI